MTVKFLDMLLHYMNMMSTSCYVVVLLYNMMSILCTAKAAGISVTLYQEMQQELRLLIRDNPAVDPHTPESIFMQAMYMDLRLRLTQQGKHPAKASAARQAPDYFDLLTPDHLAMPIKNVELTPKGAAGSPGRLAYQAFEKILMDGAKAGHFRFDEKAPSFNHPDGPTDEGVRWRCTQTSTCCCPRSCPCCCVPVFGPRLCTSIY